MGFLLFLVFLAVPLLEIALFIVIGGQIGVLATVAAVVATALAGAILVRHQGLTTLARTRRELDEGRIPTGTMGEGLAILFAGALLLTPGFFTDVVGFALLVPPLRRTIVKHLGRWIGPRVSVVSPGGFGGGPRDKPGRGPVIEGEAIDLENQPPREPDPDSPWRND